MDGGSREFGCLPLHHPAYTFSLALSIPDLSLAFSLSLSGSHLVDISLSLGFSLPRPRTPPPAPSAAMALSHRHSRINADARAPGVLLAQVARWRSVPRGSCGCTRSPGKRWKSSRSSPPCQGMSRHASLSACQAVGFATRSPPISARSSCREPRAPPKAPRQQLPPSPPPPAGRCSTAGLTG